MCLDPVRTSCQNASSSSQPAAEKQKTRQHSSTCGCKLRWVGAVAFRRGVPCVHSRSSISSLSGGAPRGRARARVCVCGHLCVVLMDDVCWRKSSVIHLARGEEAAAHRQKIIDTWMELIYIYLAPTQTKAYTQQRPHTRTHTYIISYHITYQSYSYNVYVWVFNGY